MPGNKSAMISEQKAADGRKYDSRRLAVSRKQYTLGTSNQKGQSLSVTCFFISQCSYYVTTRMSILGKPVLDPDDMKRIRVKDQTRFISKSRRFLTDEISN